MGLLDSINWGNLASGGMQLYGAYQQHEAANDYQDQYQAAEDAQRQYLSDYAEYQSYLASLGEEGGSGGGGAARPKMTQDMLNQWQGYMNKAEAQYQPYAAAGAKAIGPMTDAYLGGLGIAKNLADAYATPEGLQRMNQGVPASSIQYNIPRRTR